MKIVVYRTGNLGDTVCAIPAFRLIRERYPEAELTFLCDRPNEGNVGAVSVVSRLGLFDQIETYRSAGKLASLYQLFRASKRVQPDMLICLTQNAEPRRSLRYKELFFRWSGIRDVRGFELAKDCGTAELNEPARLIRILNQCGISGPKPAYAIPVESSAQAAAHKALISAGVEPSAPFAVFCGGGKFPVQHWPLERYAQVIRSVQEKYDWPIIALGSPSELALYKETMHESCRELVFLDAHLDIAAMFELFRCATVYIGNDTGPMHVAAAVGCPVVTVMSARDAPGAWYPDVQPRLFMRNRVDCEKCYLSACITEKHRCLLDISADRVISALLPFLQSLPLRMDANKSQCTTKVARK